MADILSDFSPASMAQAVEANLFAFFRQLNTWPRVEVHDDADALWTLSDVPFPLFNSVLGARLDAGADDAIDARLRAGEARGVPLLWWTGPSSSPADLGERLVARGFLEEPAHGMVADLGRPLTETWPDRSVTIESVGDAGTLAAWSRVLCQAFGAPPAFGEAFGGLAGAIGLGAGSPFRHFLARVNGQSAATCSLFLGAGVAGIYDVATLPERRRRGLGGLVTRHAMAVAREAGYRMAILHSSAMGAGVYRSIGFRDVCPIGQYVWAPPGFSR